MKFFYLPLLLLLSIGGYRPAFAVPDFAIEGSVHDTNGGRIARARVAVTRIGSQESVEALTREQGEFRVAAPRPGSYRVEVTAEGFSPYSQIVDLSEDRPGVSLDVTLEIAAQTDTVEVTANELAAETTSTQLGETLESKKIESVPLNGRSFTDLMAVQPGIVPANTAQPGAVIMTGVASTPPSGDANPGNLSISGQREASNGFRVNGSDVEEDVNMGTSIVPNLDAIDSFRVLTSNFDAEYGNSSGGQVLVMTKSGTAQVHGIGLRVPAQHGSRRAQLLFCSSARPTARTSSAAAVGGSPFHRSVAVFADYQGTRLTEGHRHGRDLGSVHCRAGRRLQPGSAHRQRERQRLGGAAFHAAGPARLPQASRMRRSFPTDRFHKRRGPRRPSTCWPRFRNPTPAQRSSPPPPRPRPCKTTKAHCAWTGRTARAR